MDGWSHIKAADFIDFNPRESLPKNTEVKKVAMECLQTFTRDVAGYEVAPFNGGTKFRNGDTIMARITPCLENGKTAQVDFLGEDEIGCGSTEFIVMRAKAEISDKDFVYYLAISPFFRDIAIQSMIGSSGRQRVQQSVLDATELFVPPLPKQIEIGRTLRTLDDKIANNAKINHHLEQMAQAIFKSWFVDFEPFGGEMPSDWREGTLADIASVTMGQSPDGSSYNESGTGTVFYQGRTDFGSRFPTRRLFTTQPKRLAIDGDILVSVRAPVGDLNVATEPCCLGRGLAGIKIKSGNQSFILYTMFALKQQLDMFNGEGTVFGSINKNDMAALSVVIPTDEVVQQFESIVKPMDATIRNNFDEICHLQATRDALLPRLMSGELSVTDLAAK